MSRPKGSTLSESHRRRISEGVRRANAHPLRRADGTIELVAVRRKLSRSHREKIRQAAIRRWAKQKEQP